MLHIEQIRPELTWRLRKEVLYPKDPLFKMEMDEDNDGWHFGAFKDDALVAVVSLFENSSDFQFRKFAVAAVMQRQGVGRHLLEYITVFAKNEGAKRIWCNARVTAVEFYKRAGFSKTGNHFSKNGFEYEVMEKLLN